MVVCPECHNSDRLCTYDEDATKCKPCQQQGIYCSGSLDKEEYRCLIIQEKRYNRLSTDAMHRLGNLNQRSDKLRETMQQCISSPDLAHSIPELLCESEQLLGRMDVEESAMNKNSSFADAVRKARAKMLGRELRALEQHENDEVCETQEVDVGEGEEDDDRNE